MDAAGAPAAGESDPPTKAPDTPHPKASRPSPAWSAGGADLLPPTLPTATLLHERRGENGNGKSKVAPQVNVTVPAGSSSAPPPPLQAATPLRAEGSGSTSTDGGGGGATSDLQRRIRALQKKVRQAIQLRDGHAEGKQLNAEQKAKVLGLPQLQAELRAAIEELAGEGALSDRSLTPAGGVRPAPAASPPRPRTTSPSAARSRLGAELGGGGQRSGGQGSGGEARGGEAREGEARGGEAPPRPAACPPASGAPSGGVPQLNVHAPAFVPTSAAASAVPPSPAPPPSTVPPPPATPPSATPPQPAGAMGSRGVSRPAVIPVPCAAEGPRGGRRCERRTAAASVCLGTTASLHGCSCEQVGAEVDRGGVRQRVRAARPAGEGFPRGAA